MGDFGEDSDDSDGEGGLGNVNRTIMRPAGHSGKAKRGHLCFDASFETGNLGKVDLVNEYEYDLFIRPDTCSPRFRFWFNFTVDNVRQDQRVIFNIVNISKGRNLFNDNMTPLVKSTSRPKWQRIPKKHVFYHRSLVHQNHYILSFTFGFDKEDEIFQFALAPPYSYSRLQACLKNFETKGSHLKEIFCRELLGNSVQKRRLDVITIGSKGIQGSREKRRVVAVMARIHPGESPASFVCQGMMELLISSHPIAALLRDHVIFKIVPMMNPDGVFLGNYRSTLMGFDLNRSWHVASEWGHPTLRAVTEMLNSFDKSKDFQLDFVLDIHAHSTLKGCFIYGNTYEDVYRYERHIVFPKLLATVADDYISSNTMFNADVNKIGTARRHLCSLLSDKVNCYTFETSIFGYQSKGSEIVIPYTESSYMRCGRNLVRAFLEYYQVTGLIPLQISGELSQKKKRRPKSFHNLKNNAEISTKRRPKSTRNAATIHYNDLTLNYDSETSLEDVQSSHRYGPVKVTARFSDRDNILKMQTRKQQTDLTFTILPQPSLSIIDFNLITRNGIEEACKRNKK